MSGTDIAQIIQKYGQPVYDAALRQVYVEIALRLAWILILIVVAIVCLKTLRWSIRKAKEAKGQGGYDPEFPYVLGGIGSGVGILLSVLITLLLANDTASALLNPTWAAIQIIISAAKPS